ncbi:MAG: efflux RND transporter permease subunit, partial [Gammaproteobacteria bacterium]|nr:efflux RND transporter permease subunit [Gammaproteobacteria bacterium]
GDDIRDTLSDLIKSGMIGAILAICVLYLFLRQLSTTLIVTLSVPLSLLITLGALYFLGFSLNILSMMGMMLAVGMLVDNAVVVTENIFRRRQCEEGDPLTITSNAVSEVGLAVIAGTFTSISVFLPIIFGDKNQIAVFLTHVAIAITVAMLASLLIAQTLIPMLASRVKLPEASDKSAFMTRLADRYASILAVAIKRKWLMLLLTVLTLSSGIIAQKLVNVDMFPQESGRKLYLPYNLKAKYPLTVVENSVDKVEEYLYSNKEALNVAAVYTYFTEEEAQSMILLTPEEDATLSTKKIIAKIEEELPEIIIGEPNFKFDQQGGNDGFSLQINGDSAEQLSVIAREVIQVITGVPGLKDVRLETAEQERELQVIIDRDQAARFGLSPLEIAGTIAVAMRGQNLREFRGDQGEVDVRLAFRDDDQETLENLATMQLRTADGNLIELSTVARFRFALGAQEISRVRRKTAAVIEANLEDSSLEEIRPLVETAMSGYALPIGYSWKFGKGVEQANDTEKQMGINIILAVVLIFFVMAAVFESVLYPLSIMISIGLSIVGVYWFFAVTGTTFSFMATIGILILIGVVVNNGIVLIDHVNNLRHRGIDRNTALVQAGRDRLRPILMTVATTILGLLPLAVGSTQVGGDGPPYYPMARAIIGGLAFSTIASLFIVPYVYVVVDSMAKWTRKVGRIARNPTLAR